MENTTAVQVQVLTFNNSLISSIPVPSSKVPTYLNTLARYHGTAQVQVVINGVNYGPAYAAVNNYAN